MPGQVLTRGEWEYRTHSMKRGTTREEARIYLSIAAQFGEWELARLILWPDGRRKVWLRRKYEPGRVDLPLPTM